MHFVLTKSSLDTGCYRFGAIIARMRQDNCVLRKNIEMKNKFLALLSGLVLFGINFQAGATVIYSDQASWQNDTTNIELIDFNGFSSSELIVTPTYTIGSATFSSPNHLTIVENLGYDSAYLTSGYLEWQGTEPTMLTVTFDSYIDSLSFDFGKFYGGVDTFSIVIDSNTYTATTNLNDYAFWGIQTDTGFNSFTISSSNFPIIDNLAFGDSVSVPEPASLALLSLGLAGIGFSRKKKKV